MITFIIDNVTTVGVGLKKYPKLLKCLDAYAPGYQYTYKYKCLGWNGKISLFDGETFPTGLLPLLIEEINKAPIKIPMTIQDNRVIKPLTTLKPSTVSLRDYQLDAVNKAIGNTYLGTWWPRGVIQVATGGGKTEIAADLIQKTGISTIFLVHRTDLEQQTIERFKKYGISAGDIDDGKLVTVTTVQSLMSCTTNFEKNYIDHEGNKRQRTEEWLDEKAATQTARKKEILSLLSGIEQVFIDEAHLVAAKMENANLFSTALSWMPNAYMRWGLTATPFMRDKLHNWMLEGATGSAIVKITNRELIDAGYLTEAQVHMYDLGINAGVPKTWPDCYEFGIVVNTSRNMKIIECLKTYPQPALVLVTKIGHGELLEKMAAKAGIKIPFLHGGSTKAERKQALQDMKNGKLKGVIASTIWDEGMDIPNIQTVILAGGGKSEIKNLQRLGRGLRTSSNKQTLYLVDFIDRTPRTLHNHSNIRMKLWEEQGFGITIKK